MIQYKIYIYGLKKNPYTVPIPPREVTRTSNGRTERVDILGLGEVALLKDRELETYSWETFFPADEEFAYRVHPDSDWGIPTNEALDMFLDAKNKKQVLKLYVTRTLEDGTVENYISSYCTITNFIIKDKGANVNDIFYNITFQEYKAPLIITQEIVNPPQVTTTTTQNNTINVVDKKSQQDTVGKVLDYEINDRVKVTGQPRRFETITYEEDKTRRGENRYKLIAAQVNGAIGTVYKVKKNVPKSQFSGNEESEFGQNLYVVLFDEYQEETKTQTLVSNIVQNIKNFFTNTNKPDGAGLSDAQYQKQYGMPKPKENEKVSSGTNKVAAVGEKIVEKTKGENWYFSYGCLTLISKGKSVVTGAGLSDAQYQKQYGKPKPSSSTTGGVGYSGGGQGGRTR